MADVAVLSKELRGPYQFWLWEQHVKNPHFFDALHGKWLITFGHGMRGLRWQFSSNNKEWPLNRSVYSLLHTMSLLAPHVQPSGVASAYLTGEGELEVPLPSGATTVYVGGPIPNAEDSVPHPYHPGQDVLVEVGARLGRSISGDSYVLAQTIPAAGYGAHGTQATQGTL